MCAALYHTIILLHVDRLLQYFIWRYPGIIFDLLDNITSSRSKVQVTKNMKLTDCAVTFEPDVVETSGCWHVVPY